MINSKYLNSISDKTSLILHEIKNPITTIICNAQFLMLENKLNGHINKRISAIEKEALRIKDLTQNFISLSPETFKNDKINVLEILEEIIFLFEPELKNKKIEIDNRIDNKNIFFYGDENRLKQILINILKNAIDSITGKNGKIVIHTKLKNNNILISISDNGCGIKKNDIPKLFTPFFHKKTTEESSGLGLFITSEIVKAYSGKIMVSSKYGKGSVFTIKLGSEQNR